MIISHGMLTGGSALTERYAMKHERPCLHIDLNEMTDLEAALKTATWISKNSIAVLNVAGPRASKDPEIYQAVFNILESTVHLCSVKTIPPNYIKPDTGKDSDVINAILGEMPLREKSPISNMDREQVNILQQAFEMYIRSRMGSDANDDDFNDIIIQLWQSLKETHKIRVVE